MIRLLAHPVFLHYEKAAARLIDSKERFSAASTGASTSSDVASLGSITECSRRRTNVMDSKLSEEKDVRGSV